ncbi:hypothetical protein [Ktedonobacter sp. SOSP1-85]|uniref:hypothetical protein n=1 Tax=Ktedonobacter sp. SOSP1-85 TaxID=2778367 RepID=UPI001F21A25A|nr:hypothetical protein [Ktedonobacter sp. SOSP1-85]
MTEFLLPSWYRAVQVPGRREQKTLFATLEKLVSTINMTLTVNTYMAGGNYYTVIFCLGSTVPSEREQERLEAALTPYAPSSRLRRHSLMPSFVHAWARNMRLRRTHSMEDHMSLISIAPWSLMMPPPFSGRARPASPGLDRYD